MRDENGGHQDVDQRPGHLLGESPNGGRQKDDSLRQLKDRMIIMPRGIAADNESPMLQMLGDRHVRQQCRNLA